MMRILPCVVLLLFPLIAIGEPPRDADAEVAAVNLINRIGGKITVVADRAVAIYLDGNRKLTDQHLEIISKLPHVKVFDLSGTWITDAGVAHLARMSSLTLLNLNGTETSDIGLRVVTNMPDLRALLANRTQITDAAMDHVQTLSKLEGLDISDTRVSDLGVSAIKGLTGLKSLWLGGTKISDETM